MLKLVSVLYKNNTYDVIESKKLEGLISSDSILKFFSPSGWVTINVDPIRETSRARFG